MDKSEFDAPFGPATGSGVIFGASGGVMEAALRTVFELVTGQKADPDELAGMVSEIRGFEGVKYKELTLPNELGPVPDLLKKNKHLPFDNWDWLKGATLKLAVCHGTANAKKVMENINAGGKFSECHFIEFMACPGGCLGGGGQPIPTSPEIRAKRANAIYSEDKAYDVRKSHENPAVAEIYEKFLGEGPCGHLAHELLHTHYTPRGKYII
jgi:NADH-quinone oxidoreductase subunit G/[NiFe] hydrogenase diaphorase moiety small subunit